MRARAPRQPIPLPIPAGGGTHVRASGTVPGGRRRVHILDRPRSNPRERSVQEMVIYGVSFD
ncbi:MAG: hypothetical protein QOF04_335, partial [Solirubrobacteraceae bacterium]|nr:hypothetical protein [Solirubrobacteraceae bacterium]